MEKLKSNSEIASDWFQHFFSSVSERAYFYIQYGGSDKTEKRELNVAI